MKATDPHLVAKNLPAPQEVWRETEDFAEMMEPINRSGAPVKTGTAPAVRPRGMKKVHAFHDKLDEDRIAEEGKRPEPKVVPDKPGFPWRVMITEFCIGCTQKKFSMGGCRAACWPAFLFGPQKSAAMGLSVMDNIIYVICPACVTKDDDARNPTKQTAADRMQVPAPGLFPADPQDILKKPMMQLWQLREHEKRLIRQERLFEYVKLEHIKGDSLCFRENWEKAQGV